MSNLVHDEQPREARLLPSHHRWSGRDHPDWSSQLHFPRRSLSRRRKLLGSRAAIASVRWWSPDSGVLNSSLLRRQVSSERATRPRRLHPAWPGMTGERRVHWSNLGSPRGVTATRNGHPRIAITLRVMRRLTRSTQTLFPAMPRAGTENATSVPHDGPSSPQQSRLDLVRGRRPQEREWRNWQTRWI